MADRRRQQEIEEKRAKIAELRRAREERKAQQEKAAAEPLTTSRRDINELVDSLLAPANRPTTPHLTSSRQTPTTSHTPLPPLTSGRATPSIPGTPGGRLSRLSNDDYVGEGRRDLRLGPAASLDRQATSSPVTEPLDYVDHATELYELPSKPLKAVTYSKAIQTTAVSTSTSTSDLEDDDDDEDEGRRKRATDDGVGRETEDEMRKRILHELEEERKALEKELQELKSKEIQRPPDLTSEQRQAIYAAPDFSSFIEQSAKIVQRALSDNYDYTRDYTISIDAAFDDSDSNRVKLQCTFSDDRWTKGRSVTDLDWSSKFPELLVASYNKNPSALSDPDGIVAVWNLHMLGRPEFLFHSPSDVLAVTFSPFHPSLVFGGSYSGQILLWDTRAKHLPVLKTPLSSSGHTYPIYAMKMIGTQNANSLLTSSTDGMVCSWLVDMLAQPQESLTLTSPSNTKSDEVSISCFDSPDSDTATLWVGTEEGSVYRANRYDRANSKAGVQNDDVYRGHAGPITGIHFHPSSGSIDFSDLFLTSSVDWTVKLWRTRGGKSAAAGAGPTAGPVAAVQSFEEADDYVFDVKWHPNHPAVFGTVDGTGKFDLWNLNQDTEVPIVSTAVCDKAINKLAWDRTPMSRKAALGSADGSVYIYDVAERLVSPRDNEWVEMQKKLQALVANRDAGGGLGSAPLPDVGAGRYR